ncbi:hypothetical protein MRX96_028158 [Rhipicephalus microplus]
MKPLGRAAPCAHHGRIVAASTLSSAADGASGAGVMHFACLDGPDRLHSYSAVAATSHSWKKERLPLNTSQCDKQPDGPGQESRGRRATSSSTRAPETAGGTQPQRLPPTKWLALLHGMQARVLFFRYHSGAFTGRPARREPSGQGLCSNNGHFRPPSRAHEAGEGPGNKGVPN